MNFLPRSKLWRWRKTFWAIFLMLCCATLANTAFLDKIFIQHSRIFSWHFSDQVSGDIYLSSLRPRAPALLSEMSDIKSWTSTWGHALICAEFIKRIQSSHLLAEWGHVPVVHVASGEVTYAVCPLWSTLADHDIRLIFQKVWFLVWFWSKLSLFNKMAS